MRQLLWMYKGVIENDWWHTSHLLATMVNTVSDQAVEPSEMNPTIEAKSIDEADGLDKELLKSAFSGMKQGGRKQV